MSKVQVSQNLQPEGGTSLRWSRPAQVRVFLPACFLAVTILSACAAQEGVSQGSSALIAPNAVTDWSARVQTAVAPGRGSGSATYLQAIAQLAVYDAVVAIKGGYAPFNADLAAPEGADVSAAVATAAWRVVRERVPAQAASMDGQYATYLAGIPDGQSKADGIAVGEASAAAMLAARAGDNFSSNLSYVQPPVGPGVWEPTLATPPVDYNLQFVIPITSDSPESFRPGPPPDLTSRSYAADVSEVQALGRIDSTVRTAEQLDVALFWSESAFTLWTRGVRNVAIAQRLEELETARLMAMTTLAAADALISCWEAKYHYASWRPIHAITRADTDHNSRTTADPTWTAVLNQNHPEYPAGHGCYGSSVVTAMKKYFMTDEVAISLDSTTAGLSSPTHSYARLSDILDETGNARVWAGVHFRHTMKVSVKLGQAVARHALHRQFRPVKDHDDRDCSDDNLDEDDDE
jgi:hypothetical protein